MNIVYVGNFPMKMRVWYHSSSTNELFKGCEGLIRINKISSFYENDKHNSIVFYDIDCLNSNGYENHIDCEICKDNILREATPEEIEQWKIKLL